MPMMPDDFHFHIPNGAYIPNNDEDLNAMPDLPYIPILRTLDDTQKIRSMLCPPSLDELLNNTEKVKKIKELVKKCTNLNIYIDGENIFKKILEICEGK